MADLVNTKRTTLSGEDVHVRAAQFFTNAQWRVQSQSPRVSTFVGKPKIPWVMLFLMIIAFACFVIPGIIMWMLIIRRTFGLQNIVVTTNPIDAGCEVVITNSKHAQKMIDRFLEALPEASAVTS